MSVKVNEVERVSVPKAQLMVLLDASRQIRTGFLICAPRFATGSRGEAMVSVAAELGTTIDEICRQLDDNPKADPVN